MEQIKEAKERLDRSIETYIKELEKAKSNVTWLLEHSGGLADMHGIKYWAGEVERLRHIIKNN